MFFLDNLTNFQPKLSYFGARTLGKDPSNLSNLVELAQAKTRRFSNHESRLLSRAHTFAIIVILDLKIHQSMWIH